MNYAWNRSIWMCDLQLYWHPKQLKKKTEKIPDLTGIQTLAFVMTVHLVQFSKRSSAVWLLNLKDHDGDSDIFQAYRDTAICSALWRIPTTSQLRYLMFWFSGFFKKSTLTWFLKCLCIYKQSASWEHCFFAGQGQHLHFSVILW